MTSYCTDTNTLLEYASLAAGLNNKSALRSCGIVILFRFDFGSAFQKTRIRFEYCSYLLLNYLCNTCSWVVNLQQILQRYCAVLNKNELYIPYAKFGFAHVLKRSLSAHWMQVKLFITFNLNCGLHAVSVGKPSARMSNFWTARIRFGFFLYPKPNRISVFTHPINHTHTFIKIIHTADFSTYVKRFSQYSSQVFTDFSLKQRITKKFCLHRINLIELV